MIKEIKGWQSELGGVSVDNQLKNIMSLNFCFNVESRRLLGSDILVELSKNLSKNGLSCTFYGVGNLGFKFTDPFGIVASDGKYEGQHNDPSNDYDFICVSSCDYETWRSEVDKATILVADKYGKSNSPDYFHWAKITEPNWHSSNFDIPDYCSVLYKRPNGLEQSQTELHFIPNKPKWNIDLLSTYASWYSTRIGFPILHASTKNEVLYAGIWQPFANKIDKDGVHEVKISVPERFGQNSRDILQTTRIVLGVIQASISAKEVAILSDDTKDIIKAGLEKSAASLTEPQRENCKSRLKSTIHRAQSLERELEHYCRIEEIDNPFKTGGVVNNIVKSLDEVGWGMKVLGKTVEKYLRNS